jgi:uncharacterized protein (DUF2342 family)
MSRVAATLSLRYTQLRMYQARLVLVHDDDGTLPDLHIEAAGDKASTAVCLVLAKGLIHCSQDPAEYGSAMEALDALLALLFGHTEDLLSTLVPSTEPAEA